MDNNIKLLLGITDSKYQYTSYIEKKLLKIVRLCSVIYICLTLYIALIIRL